MHEPQSDTAPILVIGATGRHGGTGTTVVDLLLTRGRSVRALVHTDDERAVALRRRGATTVVADLHDRASLATAVTDVSAIYFTYPVGPGVISAAANLASVLLEAGVTPHLVVMSMVVSSHQSPSRLGQARAIAEEILIWAGVNPTVLRFAGLFHENILLLHENTIRNDALIANSFGDGPAPWIGGRDAAELSVAHLLAPPPAAAQISYPPQPKRSVTPRSPTSSRPRRAARFATSKSQRPRGDGNWRPRPNPNQHRRSTRAWRSTSHPSARPSRNEPSRSCHPTRRPSPPCLATRRRPFPTSSAITFLGSAPNPERLRHKVIRPDRHGAITTQCAHVCTASWPPLIRASSPASLGSAGGLPTCGNEI
jgi:uncharacterized protein YbjT (DUF2867 family)